MKLSIIQGAGFAGLVRTLSVDSASLAPEDAETLRAKVEDADLFHSPERIGQPSTQPDAIDYAVTVDDDGRRHTVLVSEEAMPQRLRALVDWLRSVPGRQEQVGPPGGA